MMIDENLIENFSIYNDSISYYYLASIFITVFSVLVAYAYHKYGIFKVSMKKDENQLTVCSKEFIGQDKNMKLSENENFPPVSIGKHANLAEKISATLTADQLTEEKQMEKQQLEAIFKLLQNQEDKFQIGSLQELEDQMKLYR